MRNTLCRIDEARDDLRGLGRLRLGLQLLPAGAADRVEAGASIVVRGAPTRGDPPQLFQLEKGRIQRALVQRDLVAANLLDSAGRGRTRAANPGCPAFAESSAPGSRAGRRNDRQAWTRCSFFCWVPTEDTPVHVGSQQDGSSPTTGLLFETRRSLFFATSAPTLRRLERTFGRLQKPICARPRSVRSSGAARPLKSTSKSMAAKSGAERPCRNASRCFGR